MAVSFTVDPIYTSSNWTLGDEAWKSSSPIPDTGLVALPDDWVLAKDLFEGPRCQWNESKGIYLLCQKIVIREL